MFVAFLGNVLCVLLLVADRVPRVRLPMLISSEGEVEFTEVDIASSTRDVRSCAGKGYMQAMQ